MDEKTFYVPLEESSDEIVLAHYIIAPRVRERAIRELNRRGLEVPRLGNRDDGRHN